VRRVLLYLQVLKIACTYCQWGLLELSRSCSVLQKNWKITQGFYDIQCSYRSQLPPLTVICLFQAMQNVSHGGWQYIGILELSFSGDMDGIYCICLLHGWLGVAPIFVGPWGHLYI
jgi:hypothetical protein